jgi:hypothetical protein
MSNAAPGTTALAMVPPLMSQRAPGDAQSPMTTGQPAEAPAPEQGNEEALNVRQEPPLRRRADGGGGGGGGPMVGPQISPGAPVQNSWGQLQQSSYDRRPMPR